MEKFTLYDFMSYFLPGVIALFIIQTLFKIDYSILSKDSYLEKGLLFSIAAILLGLLIHRVTFWLLNFKLYKNVVMVSIKTLINENSENLKDDYKMLVNLLKEDDEEKIFENAYYYLEFKDRISSAKGFQSMYFFIRNLITLLLVILLVIFNYFFVNNQVCNKTLLFLFIEGSFGLIVLIWIGKWYRAKFVKRVYKTFLVALMIESKSHLYGDL